MVPRTWVRPARRAGALGVMLALYVAVGGCGRRHGAEGPGSSATPKPISTLTVAAVPTATEAEVPGTVQAVRQAQVAPRLMARLLSVKVHEGEHVRAGQVLAVLDSSDIQAQAAQASASVGAAQASLRQAEAALKMQRVTSSVEVQQAEAALTAARANLEKVKRGPRTEQREQAAQAVNRAQAALDAAQAQLDLVREGARKQQRKQAAEAVAQAQQGLEAAQQGVIAAEAAVRTMEADYQRTKALADQDVVPKQSLDHAQLAKETAQARLAQAQAAEAQARSALEQARQQESLVQEGARTQEVREAEEAVKQAQAGYEQAKLDLQMADRGGRAEDVTGAESQVRQAEEALRNAQAAQGRNQLREADVAAATASVRQAQAGVRSTRVMLDYATIVAPMAGVVTARHVDPGSMASPGLPLFAIEDTSSYRLHATVPENLISSLHVGGTVTVTLATLGGKWEAKVVEIVPAADPASHTFVVKAKLPADERVHSGLFGRLVVHTGEREATVVPESAIWRQGNLTGVFTVSNGQAHLRMVQVGAARSGGVEINSGLRSGEVVAVDASGLSDGDPVTSESEPTR
jgi:RND family efflux transporter MFP subunit